jgi:molecular chaperone GrpE (heat shock protein)
VHEAVQSLGNDAHEVVQELEAGYKTHDRLIYPAKVVVGPSAETHSENS